MVTFKTELEDYESYEKDEHSLEQYLERFDIKFNRENILDKVKTIMVKSNLQEIRNSVAYKNN